MTNRSGIIYVFIIITLTFIGMGLYETVTTGPTDPNTYVAARGGSKCYTHGHEHKNIKYKKLFDSLEECEEYIGGFIIND